MCHDNGCHSTTFYPLTSSHLPKQQMGHEEDIRSIQLQVTSFSSNTTSHNCTSCITGEEHSTTWVGKSLTVDGGGFSGWLRISTATGTGRGREEEEEELQAREKVCQHMVAISVDAGACSTKYVSSLTNDHYGAVYREKSNIPRVAGASIWNSLQRVLCHQCPLLSHLGL